MVYSCHVDRTKAGSDHPVALPVSSSVRGIMYLSLYFLLLNIIFATQRSSSFNEI
jgi:hypothetical protein